MKNLASTHSFAKLAVVALSVQLAAPVMASASTPVPGNVFWHPDEAHCRFIRTDAEVAEPDKPETWRYLFVTELISDDIASAERGYMRLDGLLRELEFLSREQTDTGEVRLYRSFGELPVSVEVDMRAGEGKKSKLGQTILVSYSGTVTLERENSLRFVPFTGSCGVEPKSQ